MGGWAASNKKKDSCVDALGVSRATCMRPMDLDDVNVAEILDRVMDNGIVVEASARVILLSRELRGLNDKLVVDSIQTNLFKFKQT